MTQAMELLRKEASDALAQTDALIDNLTDDPDCLAELEFTYSVFRFRYTWGTVYEVMFTNHADAEDRKACFALVPIEAVYLDTLGTNTSGLGMNGIHVEITHRAVTAVV